jgi:hypothetical protein
VARPERHDVDYFPFIVKRGKTLNILQSKFGLEGIGFFTNLLRFLGTTPDHYYCIKEEYDRLNFFSEIGMHDEEKGIAIIELMVMTGKLDKQLWEEYKVIACEAFLDSLEDAYKRRTNKIITIAEIREIFQKGGKNPVYVKNNLVSVDILYTETQENNDSRDNNPQTKLNKTKLKKTKTPCGSVEPPLSESQKSANELSELLLTSHRKEFPDYLSGKTKSEIEKKLEGWVKDIELLIRLDKKDPEIIRQVILWVKDIKNVSANGFTWFHNIESGAKLRKQFERLFGEMKTKTRQGGKAMPHKIERDNVPPEKLDKYFH